MASLSAGMQKLEEGGPRLISRGVASNAQVYFSATCSLMGAFSMGYMISYSSPALPAMEKDGTLQKHESSWFGSLVTFGAMFGCILGGYIVEKVGRKGTLLVTSVPFFLGWVLIWGSMGVNFLYLGRLLTGLGTGIVMVASPMYISETSPKELRGMLGSGVQLSITVGILVVNLLGLWLGWRSLAAIGALIPLGAVILTVKIPETPRFFLLNNRRADAIRSLQWLRGPNYDVEDELRDIEETLEPSEKFSWSELLKPELLNPLKVAIGLMIWQQLTGINVVMFYTVSIFESAGFKNGMLAAVAIGAVQVIMTLVACVLMDRAGRRVLLLIAGVGMMVTNFTMGYYYHSMMNISETVQAPDMSWLAMTSLIFYIVAFSLGWGPIPMLVTSEIFPVRARGTASALAVLASWIGAFLVTKYFTTLQEALGQDGAFWFFSVCCGLSLLFVYRMVPETKGKSLEDIELYFLGRAQRDHPKGVKSVVSTTG